MFGCEGDFSVIAITATDNVVRCPKKINVDRNIRTNCRCLTPKIFSGIFYIEFILNKVK